MDCNYSLNLPVNKIPVAYRSESFTIGLKKKKKSIAFQRALFCVWISLFVIQCYCNKMKFYVDIH